MFIFLYEYFAYYMKNLQRCLSTPHQQLLKQTDYNVIMTHASTLYRVLVSVIQNLKANEMKYHAVRLIFFTDMFAVITIEEWILEVSNILPRGFVLVVCRELKFAITEL